MHGAVRTGPDPGKVRHPDSFKRQTGARGEGLGVRGWGLGTADNRVCADHLIIVFTQEGSWTANLPPGFMKLVGRPQVGEGSRMRMRHLDEEVSGTELFLHGKLGHSEYRGKANAFFLSGPEQVLDLPPLHPFIQVHLEDVLDEWMQGWKVEDLFRAGQEKRICFAPVFTMAQLAVQEQLRARNFFVEVTHPHAGTLTHLGAPYQLHEPWWKMRRPAPRLGEHNEEVLGALPVTSSARLRTSDPGLPEPVCRLKESEWR